MSIATPNGSSDKSKNTQLLTDQAHYLKVFNRFAVSLLQQNTIDEIAWDIAKNAIAGLKFVDCVVYLIEDDMLVQKAAHGPKNPIAFDILNPIKIPLGRGVVGTVAKTGLPEIIHDTSADGRYIIDDAFRFSEIAVPIVAGDKVIGVIDSEHPDKNFFTKQHLELLTTIASMVTTKLLQARAQEELQRQNERLEKMVAERTKKLNKALEKLQQSNEDLKTFSYSVSHDLKQPLRMISSYIGLLKRRNEHLFDDNAKEYMKFILDGSSQMKNLIDDLLEYSKVGFQNVTDFEMVDLNHSLSLALINLDTSIKEANAIIYSDVLPEILGIKTILLQLFQNIIGNALKFRATDRPMEVVIAYEKVDEFHKISISDTGIGISKEQYEHVFRIFNRLRPKDYEGTGIGLALCKKIVEKHGGRIWLNSTPKEGTTFHFTLKDNMPNII